jgi:hypothetical protein
MDGRWSMDGAWMSYSEAAAKLGTSIGGHPQAGRARPLAAAGGQ